MAVATLFTATACGTSPTQLVVVVDSDLAVPNEIAAVVIDLVSPSGEEFRSSGPVERPTSLPATVTIVHTEGPLGPVSVTATGTTGGNVVIVQQAVTSFVDDEIRVLAMELSEACVNISCNDRETCRRGACTGTDVGVDELRVWTGTISPPREVDAGMDGGQSCGGNCPTAPPNGASGCVDGSCVLTCDPLWADCNGDPSDGCEVLLTSASTCGDCARRCEDPTPLCEEIDDSFQCVGNCAGDLTLCASTCADLETSATQCGECDRECTAPPNATPECTAAECGFECDPGFADCDGEPANGCESQLRDLVDCGGCGVVCALPGASATCSDGACVLAGCDPGRGDCDGNGANGCEVDLGSSPDHCGTCGTACPTDPEGGSSVCENGECVLVCDPGLADCDGLAATGCEASLGAPTSCGACGIACGAPTNRCSGDPIGGYACAETCVTPETECGPACVSLLSDPSHCGMCDMGCPDPPRSTPTCAMGTCGYACNPGWGDCDTLAATGCERSLSTAADCGACGVACDPERAIGFCPGGVCRVQACEPGFGDCDENAANGCELALTSVTHCGECGLACPASVAFATAVRCTSGRCVPTCSAGRGDCDGRVENGCETDLTTLANCGSCDAVCALMGAIESCSAGTCQIQACEPGRANCDGSQGNGCEIDLGRDSTNCGVCGQACATGTSCCGGVCGAGPCP